MAVQDNRPQLSWLTDHLASVPAAVMAPYLAEGNTLLQRLLDASIAWVEDLAATSFNPQIYTIAKPDRYDGNTTNQIVLRKRPILSIQQLQVVTPILGYTRVYTPEEIKSYAKQGVLKVFTYKLAVEQALLQTVDYQAWGSLFPPLPQAVELAYTYGYPQFDPDSTAVTPNGPATSFDGGITWEPGDQRDPELNNWLSNLQQAAVCDAAASFLAQVARGSTGFVTSVSFDGYSRSLNTEAFGAQVTSLIKRRDELMRRRRRQFYMSTVGGH